MGPEPFQEGRCRCTYSLQCLVVDRIHTETAESILRAVLDRDPAVSFPSNWMDLDMVKQPVPYRAGGSFRLREDVRHLVDDNVPCPGIGTQSSNSGLECRENDLAVGRLVENAMQGLNDGLAGLNRIPVYHFEPVTVSEFRRETSSRRFV